MHPMLFFHYIEELADCGLTKKTFPNFGFTYFWEFFTDVHLHAVSFLSIAFTKFLTIPSLI
jgi:hypothetical protein